MIYVYTGQVERAKHQLGYYLHSYTYCMVYILYGSIYAHMDTHPHPHPHPHPPTPLAEKEAKTGGEGGQLQHMTPQARHAATGRHRQSKQACGGKQVCGATSKTTWQVRGQGGNLARQDTQHRGARQKDTRDRGTRHAATAMPAASTEPGPREWATKCSAHSHCTPTHPHTHAFLCYLAEKKAKPSGDLGER